jgi:hypothetical protein
MTSPRAFAISATVAPRVGDKIYLKTWNNRLSEISSDTLIKPSSSIYNILLGLRKGDKVRLFGGLFSSGPDCYREGSLTLERSIREPEFIMRFSRVEKIELPPL